MKRLLVVGGNGFVGGRLVKMAVEQGLEPWVADFADAPVFSEHGYIHTDVTDKESVEQAVLHCAPSIVVNVAAVADVDKAQQNQNMAYAVNVEGAKFVAASAKKHGAHNIWFSSDAVYQGTADMYSEQDKLMPVNYYGETKRLGELAVLEQDSSATILRLSLVLGFPVAGGNSFVQGLYNKLSAGEHLQCPVTEVRTPVDVYTLAAAVLELGTNKTSGIYNIGCTSSIDRYQLSCKLAAAMGLDVSLLEKQLHPSPGRAPRHNNGILNTSKLASVLTNTRLKTIDETIAAAIKR